MRVIDADKLIQEIRKMDLEYMQQADVMECLEDVIRKQPTLSKDIKIEKVTNFDNRKTIK